ncbi:divergent polysaccharide deacetylase family protein [uncultured Roseobacter sp.]|uniref:divergent polysaccharide deacetylase family protein n=1 Tax=uncultured Roseobacter sp. TaxID=114847 RepID=UPI0026295750|nr:divergent polysaccharide deacetylase family protein [uncultured Roseobacter sp.]
MAGGFVKGALVGTVVSAAAAAVASVIADAPMPPVVTASAPVAQPAPQAPTGAAAATSQADSAPVTPVEVPKATSPDADTLAAVRPDDLRAPRVPQTGGVAALTEPTRPTVDAPEALTQQDSPARPASPVTPLAVPEVAGNVAVSTQPAPPPVADPVAQSDPPLAESTAPPQPQTPTTVETGPLSDAPVPDLPDRGAPAVASSGATLTPSDLAISLDPAQPPQPALPPQSGAFAAAPPEPSDIPSLEEDVAAPQPARGTVALPGGSPSAVPQARETFGAAPTEAVPDLASGDVLAGLDAPAGGGEELAPDVAINALPELTDVPVTGFAPTGQQGIGARISREQDPPLVRFAAEGPGADDRPRMAIVLLDTGVDLAGSGISPAALSRFPHAVSVAVDSRLPDASDRMAAYRKAGLEVLTTLDLAAGAVPDAAARALSEALAAVPEAVGVLEGVGGGVDGSPGVAAKIANVLADTGHGLITREGADETARKLAVSAGVPAGVVFHDLDGKGQSPTVMGRFLDQAAFRATRQDRVIVLGRLRPETVTALLTWAQHARAQRVALVPVSAALRE